MRYTILLNKDENTKEVEAQEQSRFVKTVLEALEVPIDWDPDEPFSIDTKLKFKKSLSNFHINIVDDMNGGIKIFVNKDLIGEWHKCIYKLKKDLSQIDPRSRLFIEMNVNFWTIFDEK